MDFKPKLVAFDLDGTLAPSKERLSPTIGELLASLLNKMPVAIISGAAFHQFEQQVFPSLPTGTKLEHLYLFPTNAAQCYSYKNGTWIRRYDEAFTKEQQGHILAVLQSALAKTGLNHPEERVWGEQIEDRGAQITFSALGQHAPVDVKQAWDPTHTKRMPLYNLLVEELPDFSIGINAATSIDITQKGINKAYGIRQLAGISGISVSEMLYVGDALEEGGNDAVVLQTGVHTREVFDPEETAKLIQEILAHKSL